MVASPDGYVHAAVLNRAAGLGVYQRYRRDQLPHHITWRQLGSGTYVVAMEPSTNRDAGRFDARERGELGYLAPGEQRHYDLEIGALSGAAGYRRVRQPGQRARRSCHGRVHRRSEHMTTLAAPLPVGRNPDRRPDPARRRAGRDPGPRPVCARGRHGRQLLPAAHGRPRVPRRGRLDWRAHRRAPDGRGARAPAAGDRAGRPGHRDRARGGQPASAPGPAGADRPVSWRPPAGPRLRRSIPAPRSTSSSRCST